jgi:hypothetical protein
MIKDIFTGIATHDEQTIRRLAEAGLAEKLIIDTKHLAL